MPTAQREITFRNLALGMNLVTAQTAGDGAQAVDVAPVTVAPRALSGDAAGGSADVKIALDRPRQQPGESAVVSATLTGAVGDALITMESVRGVTPRRSSPCRTARRARRWSCRIRSARRRSASPSFVTARSSTRSLPLVVDGPGHQRLVTLTADRATYAPGATAKIAIADGDDRADATIAVRVSDRRAEAGASFDDVAGVLASSGTTTQNLASADPPWHAWVAPAGSTAGDIFGFDRPAQAAAVDTSIAPAGARVLTWSVAARKRRLAGRSVPHERGRYVLSVVEGHRRRRRRRVVDRVDGAMSARNVPAPQTARLMLLDTYGLVYRAFFALPALTTTHGVPINAAYGFTMMLAKLIADEKPTHVIAAFDKGLPAARVAMYPAYKEHRDEMPATCARSSRSCERSSPPTAFRSSRSRAKRPTT